MAAVKTAVIVQARLGSTRLPGKVLKMLGGQTALAQCLRRCQAIPGIDAVVCAIPEGEADDIVSREAECCGVKVTRGSGSDVLSRYHKAALAVGADWIIRVTSDCPLIDPTLCGRILRMALDQGLDYACDNMPPSWPHGLDAEVFSFVMLDRAFYHAADPFEREHVTPWIRNHPTAKKGNVASADPVMAETCRWTLDFPEDYRFLAALFDLLPFAPAIPSMAEVLAVLTAHPELAEINAMHHGVRAKR